jgi:hypothetical protein
VNRDGFEVGVVISADAEDFKKKDSPDSVSLTLALDKQEREMVEVTNLCRSDKPALQFSDKDGMTRAGTLTHGCSLGVRMKHVYSFRYIKRCNVEIENSQDEFRYFLILI